MLAGVILRGGEAHVMMLAAGIALVLPISLVMFVWLVIGLKRDAEVSAALKNAFSATIFAAGCLLLSLVSASSVHAYEVHAARSFVAEMLPRLEAYRSKHGHYPGALGEVGSSRTPSLLAKQGAYTGKGHHYRFEYRESFLLSAGEFFDNKSLQWQQCDS